MVRQGRADCLAASGADGTLTIQEQVSGLTDRFGPVSCITLSDPQRNLLAALARSPRRVEQLGDRACLAELRKWG